MVLKQLHGRTANMRRYGTTKCRARFFSRPVLELLEDRVCLSAPYQYTFVAETGSTVDKPNKVTKGDRVDFL